MKGIQVSVFLLLTNYIFAQQKAELISFSKLEKRINADINAIFIINFWATWCGPCLAELPYFQRFNENNSDKNVKLLLVSFDFPKEINRVNKFIERKKLKPNVYLLSDTDQNELIKNISKNWEGTIPATWFVNNRNGKKMLIEKPLNELEINRYLKEIN